ncbi:MAG: NCS2 family permease [Lachnospiraceae bacterium]|nr:NCS2 family permease [Lachnospiraceae bacterium]
MERIFKLKEHNTTIKTEIIAGITTFLAMAYILAVNPTILGTVMDQNGVFLATAIASALATFVMAFLANYPIALSSGMGLNAYFAYTVCMSDLKGVENPYKIALTAVFVEGIIFVILSFFKFREQIINGIPTNLKYGITTGIGLFIALLGLKSAGISVSNESTLITLGDFSSPEMVLALVGLIIIVILSHFKLKSAVLIGIISTWLLGIGAELIGWYEGTSLIPDFSNGLVNFSSLSNTAFQFNFSWAANHLLSFIAILFSFLFVDLFDTIGTVVGIADKADLLDDNGELPRAGKVLLSDALGTTAGACLGTSTISSFVESSAGVGVGGKTGLTAFTTGVLFLVSIFLSPFFLAIPGFATAPALIYVGMLMFSSAAKIKFEGDIADVFSAYLAVLMMPLTYSIANGIMFGILAWVIIKSFTGKIKTISPIMWIIFVLFFFRIVTLATHFQ